MSKKAKDQKGQAKPPHEDNLFNRTSGRVHGYSSRLSRYVRLSISLRTSVAYALLLLRLFIPLALVLTVCYGVIQAPIYIQWKEETLLALPDSPPEQPGQVEITFLDAPETDTGVTLYRGWGGDMSVEPLRIRLSYIAPYEGAYARLLFPLEEDFRILSGLLWALLIILGLSSFSFITRGKRLNHRLLRPIRDIAETAQQMSEKNLSARINVAGTQNELRDLAVVINDMLDRIEAAYNRQKQFVSDASHELRTPIAVIQGYAGLLERWGKDNPDVRDEAIEAITSETQSMKELVENLLFLARHDKKTLSLTYEPFDAGEMLREMVKETAIIAKGHRVTAGAIADSTLIADRQTVKQAVRVFVDNAIKYTPVGGQVTIESEKRGDALFITVKDTGPGIKQGDLRRVFDRFYRADEARSSQTGGHGLGLAIARIIAASHGGRIHVRSKPGVGSAFTLEIPMKREDGVP